MNYGQGMLYRVSLEVGDWGNKVAHECSASIVVMDWGVYVVAIGNNIQTARFPPSKDYWAPFW